MIFRITLKDPDGVGDSISRSVSDSLPEDLDDEEREAVSDVRLERLNDFIGQWVEYGEYVTVVFDTEAGTAVVERVKS